MPPRMSSPAGAWAASASQNAGTFIGIIAEHSVGIGLEREGLVSEQKSHETVLCHAM